LFGNAESAKHHRLAKLCRLMAARSVNAKRSWQASLSLAVYEMCAPGTIYCVQRLRLVHVPKTAIMLLSSRAVLFAVFTLCTLCALGEGPVASEPLAGSIAGTWILRWEGQSSAPLEVLKIEAAGPDIRVQGSSLRGRGSFEGLAGYYAWTLDDGTTGRTTFWLDASGALHGHVRQPAAERDFVATRR
jgi:hypothetical protein